MIWGISGCSGSGKTTLAKKVARELDIQFMPASITELGKSIGLDPVQDMDLATRIDFQGKLLSALISKIICLGGTGDYIMDRTPLDTIGYLMGEITMQSHLLADPKALREANRLVEVAQNATANLIENTFIAPPLPFYEEAETRPAANPAYQKGVHLSIVGAAFSNPKIRFSLLVSDGLEARTAYVASVIEARIRQSSVRTKRSVH